MGLVAARAAGRMQARQTYRTMARMERRRSFVQSRLGMRQDFGREEQQAEPAPAAPAAPPEPDYVGELERLSQLRDQGIISNEDFEAKKKQLLGI
jgi:Short C-terminal domain